MAAFIYHVPWEPNSIRIGSIVVDEIRTVCEGLPSGRGIWNSLTSGTYLDRMEIASWLNEIRKRVCRSFGPSKPYLNGMSMHPLNTFDALWCTLIAGAHHYNMPVRAEDGRGRERFDAFLAPSAPHRGFARR